jgi:ABC-type uncharacterized transport system involved in gliding motility auxiliary subunit
MGRPAELGLDDLLESYGLRINEDLVRDASCAYVTVSQQAGFMVIQNQVPFYYLPRASSFDEESPVVQGLSSVVLYFASSIDTSLARAKGLKTQVLLKSSARSGRQQGVFKVDPTEPVTQEMFAEQGIPLVVTVEGSFVSLFAQKGIGADTTMPAGFDSSGKILSGTALSKVALIGDGDFLQDQYSGGNPDNFLLASNIIDWLADDIGLAQIRARDSGQRPLEEVDEATKMMVKTVNLAVPPLLVIGVGLIRWRWRVAVRKRLEMRNA